MINITRFLMILCMAAVAFICCTPQTAHATHRGVFAPRFFAPRFVAPRVVFQAPAYRAPVFVQRPAVFGVPTYGYSAPAFAPTYYTPSFAPTYYAPSFAPSYGYGGAGFAPAYGTCH